MKFDKIYAPDLYEHLQRRVRLQLASLNAPYIKIGLADHVSILSVTIYYRHYILRRLLLQFRRMKQYKTVIEIHGNSHLFLVYVRLSSSLAKMLFYFQNWKHFILLLISSLPRYIKSSGSYSDVFPLVVNTWAGNHEVATDKGNKAAAVYTIDLRSRNYS